MPVTSRGVSDARTARLDQAVEAVFEADALDAAVGGGLDDGADDGVEAGRVAAAGENADAFDGGAKLFAWRATECARGRPRL